MPEPPIQSRAELQPLVNVTNTYSYDYESSAAAIVSGALYQRLTPVGAIVVSTTDHGGVDRSAFLNTLNNTCTLTINGVVFSILTATVATGSVKLTVSPPIAAPPYGVQNITFFMPDTGTNVGGPIKPPIIPTSAFPPGGGVGSIGDPSGVPTFPPPTPPPIGTVPAGPLVGPAVAAAPVPPSLAGVVQPQYKTGSATSPPANGYFPLFTTTGAYAGFPNQPPAGVPIVFANIWTNPTLSGGVWTVVTPPSTATTAQIILNGWGLPGPSGSGPGPPTWPNPPGAGLPHVLASEIYGGRPEPAERSGSAVFQFADAPQLHQQVPAPHSRRKRMSARHAAGSADV